jgi:serine/threonine protein kinase
VLRYSPGMIPERIGSYRIDSLLGKGGMGEVYRAYDEELDRLVAIKVIRATGDPAPEFVNTTRERFRREARSAARLTHPAIVRVYLVLFEANHDSIVMELVEGRTLAKLLDEDGPLPPEPAMTFFRDIALGLAEAHSHDIVHRDLKVENVMVTADGPFPGRPKILDFGLAKQLTTTESSLSLSGALLGTPYAMSPEQAGSEKVDHRSDLFSLGVLFYHTLTGQSPFRAGTHLATLARVLTHHPPPVAELDARIPLALSDLLVRLLHKDPEHRPQSAVAVNAELEHIAGLAERPPAELRPSYPNELVREISEALETAFLRKEELMTQGQDTSQISQEILDLRRRIREGAQLHAGDFLLDGRFRLIEEVGRGGFGTVWKAYDREAATSWR